MSVVERYRAGDRRHPFRNDAIAGVLTFMLSTINGFTDGSPRSERWTNIAFFGVAMIVVAVRRVVPYLALATATGLIVSLLFGQRDGNADVIAYWSAMYTVGTIGPTRALRFGRFGPVDLRNGVRALSVLAVTTAIGVAVAVGPFSIGGTTTTSEPPNDFLTSVLGVLLAEMLIGSAWFIGDLVRVRRQNDRELSERNAELVRERAENERRAVVEERVRISRELHDVVAHHVSLMGVQAGAARMALRQEPQKAEAALSEVERSSRQAVFELHRLLGFLRQDEPETTAPQPTLDDLSKLIADVERTGRHIRLNLDLPETLALPSSVQLTTYRIVQEALTNAVKHSSVAPVDIDVSLLGTTLRVSVVDHGTPVSPSEPTTKGHGLLGIRERVAFHGGTVAITPSPTGFAVAATLPVELVNAPRVPA